MTQTFPTIVEGFGYAPSQPALWRESETAPLQYRDLSLRQASNDTFVGRHLRTGGAAPSGLSLLAPDAAFAFYFVLSGRVTLRRAGQDDILLHPYDAATRHGLGAPVTWDFSHDAELIELKATPRDASLFGGGDGWWVVQSEDERDYLQGDGPRAYFKYRDLGVAAATKRRIHIHVVRATKALDGGTGWHSHSMGQLFYVLRGWADLQVDRRPAVRMAQGDAMCVPKRLKHNVPAFSADYLVLEMCIPADYDTVDGEPE